MQGSNPGRETGRMEWTVTLPDNITEIAFDCGFAWPDDPDAQMDVLIGIAQSVQRCRNEAGEAFSGVLRERLYVHHHRRNRALATRLRNLRKAWREYRSRQNLDEFVRRMCE